MLKRKKNLIIANICVVICITLFVIISHILIRNGLYKCSLLEKLHLYCPGCGGTRAVYALLRLDVLSSLIYNPLVLIGGIVYAYYNIRAFIAIKKNDEQYFINQKYILLLICVALVFIYFIVRNILLLNGIDLIGDVLGGGIVNGRF